MLMTEKMEVEIEQIEIILTSEELTPTEKLFYIDQAIKAIRR